MQKSTNPQAGFFNPRIFASFLLCSAGVLLAMFSFATPAPPSATLSTANQSITYTDSTGAPLNPTPIATGVPNCGPTGALCSTFNLTIDSSINALDPVQYQIAVQWQWAVSTVDYDWFIEDSAGNVIGKNQSTADPSTVILPVTTPAGVYQLIGTLSTGAPIPYTGTIELQKNAVVGGGPGLCNPANSNCAPARFQSYPAGTGQAEDAGEPSLGIDWNPNVASLKNTTPPMKLNTGGVAFFTSGPHEWRVNFDDCSSPAIYDWEDVSSVFDQQFVLSDPIGFVDHYSNLPLGLTYPPVNTPGRVFALDLIGGEGDSLGAVSDDDGNSYLPGSTGGAGAGPDHQTLGAGPYAGTPPATASYPASGPTGSVKHAVYYCSQNIVAESQCSRSDNGGLAGSFGPSIPIFTPTQCTGGITGHVKVAPDGTVYVPNSSCGTVGTTGVAVSTDNGVTWTENNIPNSTSSQDPYVAIGQNNLGKPGTNLSGTNTIYLAYVDGNGHPKVAFSGNRGATWSTPVDLGTPYGVTHAVFPIAAAGDDNRAAVGFLGTGNGISTNNATCDPYGATLNCANTWHLYVATTYDGGQNWIVTDATPNDPVQTGTVCLQGTTCAGGRNLLDFNDMAIDSEGRILAGYADGCVNCSNTFQTQSAASHGTVTRQSGGRRLFQFFDPVEPTVPAAPQPVSALRQGSNGGALITWLEPDNSGSPITSYKVYRGVSPGGETFLASVTGASTTKYLDPSPPAGTVYYYVTAVNASGESTHCGELTLAVGPPPEDVCTQPGVTELTDPAGDPDATVIGVTNTPAPPGSDLLALHLAQPYQPDGILRLAFTFNTDANSTGSLPSGTSIYASMKIGAGYKAVHMTYKASSPTTPIFESYTPAPNSSGGVDGRFITAGSQLPAEATSNYDAASGIVTIVVKASDLGLISGNTIDGFVAGSSFTTDPTGIGLPNLTALFDEMPDGLGYTHSYTVNSNQVCRPNAAPVAVLTAVPNSGFAPLPVNFDGSGSYDTDTAPPSDTIASYSFNFGDGSAVVTQSTPTIQHTYTTAGSYPARLTVTDSRGATSTNNAQVTISVAAPQPDLIVSSLVASNNQPKQGAKVTFTATIKNQGGASAGTSKTEFLLDGKTVLATANTPTLAAGATAQASVTWSSKKGQHTVKATADRNGAVAESNETNNTKTITVTVR